MLTLRALHDQIPYLVLTLEYLLSGERVNQPSLPGMRGCPFGHFFCLEIIAKSPRRGDREGGGTKKGPGGEGSPIYGALRKVSKWRCGRKTRRA